MMKRTGPTSDIRLPPGFWGTVAARSPRLLMLDYDGTLAPFRVAREEAWPLPAVAELLESVAAAPGSEVAILSGRPLDEQLRFLGSLPVDLVGEHGWESRSRDGRTVRHPLPAECGEALQRASLGAEAAGLGRFLERKRTALVLHTRGIPRPRALGMERDFRILWMRQSAGPLLRMTTVNGGLEMRAAGRDKGTVVRELIEKSEPGVLAVYVGDDTTDEDAFREVRHRGFAIRVGAEERASLAVGRIESCEAVEGFLRRWLDTVRGVPIPGGEP
jgi:trehalose 6-phosphate phosphatase